MLPTKAITLPPRYSDEPLAQMDVTFRAGPLLNELTGLRMPLPVEVQGSWSWIERTGVNLWSEEEDVAAADQMAQFNSRPVWLREGWLKLSEALGAEPGDNKTGKKE
ncbi:MAG: hypothetical protein P8183_23980 [Anaerolineae bacterium]